MGELTVSAKTLGEIASPGFCPRCFWIKMHYRLPYQIFPSIFSHIDGYTKKVMHAHLDAHGKLPGWLAGLGEVVDYVEPPHWKRYKVYDEELDMVLRGEADAIFKKKDGSYLIGDYKTAKFTATQDRLLPIYDIQLNAYAYIGERFGFSPVTSLALIYMEPDTGDDKASETMLDDGFAMEFTGHILEIELAPEKKIPPLMRQAREIYDLKEPPKGTRNCKDCKNLDELLCLESKKSQKTLFSFE